MTFKTRADRYAIDPSVSDLAGGETPHAAHGVATIDYNADVAGLSMQQVCLVGGG